MSGSRVVAVVVTWNRKELLARNLRAVMAQTRPLDAILVVDNASSDGTAEMLAAEFPTVRVVRLAGNAGAAGGMHVGVREGLALEPDWLWLMDDDGVPAPGCLAEQLRVAGREGYALCGPVVLDASEPSLLAFPPWVESRPRTVADLRAAVGSDHSISGGPGNWNGALVGPGVWNGTLLRRDATERCALPKAEMFIWGEEHEYVLRLMTAGFRVGVAMNADFYHPACRLKQRWIIEVKILGFHYRKIAFCDPELPRSFIYARNLGYNDWRYAGAWKALARLLAGVGLFLVEVGPQGAVQFARYYVDGVTDRYALDPCRSAILSRLESVTR